MPVFQLDVAWRLPVVDVDFEKHRCLLADINRLGLLNLQRDLPLFWTVNQPVQLVGHQLELTFHFAQQLGCLLNILLAVGHL
jgi:hypothetical protein